MGNNTMTSAHFHSALMPSADSLSLFLERYMRAPIFRTHTGFLLEDNPFRRPLRIQDIPLFDFATPLDRAAAFSASGLFGHRLLLNMYEADLMFLPDGPWKGQEQDFLQFYNEELRSAADLIRPHLEQHLFGFLDQEISPTGPWRGEEMRALFEERIRIANPEESPVMQAIRNAKDPKKAADFLLVQMAGDFLTEISAMARNILGSYGPHLSELFKVLIDEYGYGVFSEKHSTLFRSTLKSRGLSTHIHAYWQFYLAGSLALVNYFHYVSRNHRHFFRYLGALYYTEATLAKANQQQSFLLKHLFGKEMDTRYFDEHAHIDQHHGRMVIEKIIEPVVSQCGEFAAAEIVKGFEEFRLLQSMADEEFIAQIQVFDDIERHRYLAHELLANADLMASLLLKRFIEPQNELSLTHSHDTNEVFYIEEGVVELVLGPHSPVTLKKGEAIYIPRFCLHGSQVISEGACYITISLPDGMIC